MSRGSKPLSLFVFHRRTFPRTCRSLSHHRRLSSTPSISHFLLLRFRRCPLSFSFSFSYALLFVLPPAFFYFLPYSLTPPFLLSLSPFRHYISPYASILFHLLASLFSLSLSLSLSRPIVRLPSTLLSPFLSIPIIHSFSFSFFPAHSLDRRLLITPLNASPFSVLSMKPNVTIVSFLRSSPVLTAMPESLTAAFGSPFSLLLY